MSDGSLQRPGTLVQTSQLYEQQQWTIKSQQSVHTREGGGGGDDNEIDVAHEKGGCM